MPEAPPPKVSAIIIVYNGETYLGEAIDSVLAQTMTDWELLICDDGSTDGSLAIAQDYEASFPGKIRSLAHPDGQNRGMSAARNLGIAHARGTYIGFLDCDDVWEPDKLRQQIAVMEANPTAGMIYGRTLIWHSWNEAATSSDYYYDLGVPADVLYPPPQLLYTLLASTGQSPTTCNALMRADLVKAVGGFEESFRGMFEDQVFFAKALLRAPVFVDQRTWAKYRQHGDSFSARSARAHADEAARLRFLAWFAAYALSHRPAQFAVHRRVARQIGSSLMRRTRRAWRELKSSPA